MAKGIREILDKLITYTCYKILFYFLDDVDDDANTQVIKASHSKKKKQKTPKRNFVEPHNVENLVYSKVALPTTMRSIYWKYFGFPANINGKYFIPSVIFLSAY